MFLSLVSGSSGNCSLISDGKTHLLADCGLSCKNLETALAKVDLKPSDLNGILITHEHTDHIRGVGAVSRKYGTPVYATLKTHTAMNIGAVTDIRYLNPDIDFEIGTIGINPFSIPHDAADPVGYNFFFGTKKLSLATDIGRMNDYIMQHLSGSIAVLLESNHDSRMLMAGRYPAALKRRISGELGHLSNSEAAQTALELIKSGTCHIMLGHLSNENNTPNTAYLETANLLENDGLKLGKDVGLSVAARYEVSCFR